MPLVATKYFGSMDYREESVYDFPNGLPGFEDQKQFVIIETPESAPLVFLQSLKLAELCFLALPILMVDPEYRLAVAGEDLADTGTRSGPAASTRKRGAGTGIGFAT